MWYETKFVRGVFQLHYSSVWMCRSIYIYTIVVCECVDIYLTLWVIREVQMWCFCTPSICRYEKWGISGFPLAVATCTKFIVGNIKSIVNNYCVNYVNWLIQIIQLYINRTITTNVPITMTSLHVNHTVSTAVTNNLLINCVLTILSLYDSLWLMSVIIVYIY